MASRRIPLYPLADSVEAEPLEEAESEEEPEPVELPPEVDPEPLLLPEVELLDSDPLELLPELDEEPLLPEEAEFDPEELLFELPDSEALAEFELEELFVEEAFSFVLVLALEDSLVAFSVFAVLFSEVASCFVWAVSVAVKIGSVFSPIPWPAVNTWISPAEMAMAINAETIETMMTLRCTRALR